MTIRERTSEGPADISAVMAEINELLDASIAADGFHIRETARRRHGVIDLSEIDFEALAKRFEKSKTQEHRARATQGGDPGAAGEAGSRSTRRAPTS